MPMPLLDHNLTDEQIAMMDALEQFGDDFWDASQYNPAFGSDLLQVISRVGLLLLAKNRKYGDSALNPVGIFARGRAQDMIDIRLDDKLSRLASGQLDEDEDVHLDLLGYLLLRQIAELRDSRLAKTPSCDSCSDCPGYPTGFHLEQDLPHDESPFYYSASTLATAVREHPTGQHTPTESLRSVSHLVPYQPYQTPQTYSSARIHSKPGEIGTFARIGKAIAAFFR